MADETGAHLPPRVYQFRLPRTRTYLSGKLAYGDGDGPESAYTLDCSIRDLSESGARISIAQQQSLPTHVYLVIMRHAVTHLAKVVWQQFPNRGLQFLKTYPSELEAVVPEGLRLLHRHKDLSRVRKEIDIESRSLTIMSSGGNGEVALQNANGLPV
jgi:PilZ domain-containing protein